jgi:hypothetical protein|tara:strand:+ start:8934 stop:9308 length:375 start_codon:yes stop_codon:yes gene_type:complete
MEKINDMSISDLSKAINGIKLDKNNTIYDEIKKKEKNMKEVIDRVIDYEKIQDKKKEFLQTPISTIIINTFQNINDMLDDILKSDKLTNKRIKKILGIKNRQIYLGIFIVLISIFLAMIEIADA